MYNNALDINKTGFYDALQLRPLIQPVQTTPEETTP